MKPDLTVEALRAAYQKLLEQSVKPTRVILEKPTYGPFPPWLVEEIERSENK